MELIYAIGDFSSRLHDAHSLNMRLAYVTKFEELINHYLQNFNLGRDATQYFTNFLTLEKNLNGKNGINDYIATLNECALCDDNEIKKVLRFAFSIENGTYV